MRDYKNYGQRRREENFIDAIILALILLFCLSATSIVEFIVEFCSNSF